MKTKTTPKNEDLLNIGIIFRKLRIQNGFRSAEMFSYEHDLNRTAYWRWENGQNITMKNFLRLCAIHKISPQEFFEMIQAKKSRQTDFKIASEPVRAGYTSARDSASDEIS